jgi:hypothetical protein
LAPQKGQNLAPAGGSFPQLKQAPLPRRFPKTATTLIRMTTKAEMLATFPSIEDGARAATANTEKPGVIAP